MSNATDITKQIEELHAAWNAATGQQLRLRSFDYQQQWGYHQFIKAGFSIDDLRVVVAYLQKAIKKGTRLEGSLRWSNCVGDVLRFDEDLSAARAALRVKQPTPKDRIVRQYERPVGEGTPALTPMTAKSAGEWIKGMEILRKAVQ